MKDNRDRILDAARARFSAVGVHGTSVEEIAREAGLSRSSFYRAFRSIDDVVVALALRRGGLILSDALTVSACEQEAGSRWCRFVLEAILAQADKEEAFELQQATTVLVYHSSPEDFARLVDIVRPSIEADQMSGALKGDIPAREIVEWLLRQIWSFSVVPRPGGLDVKALSKHIELFVTAGLESRRQTSSRALARDVSALRQELGEVRAAVLRLETALSAARGSGFDGS